MEFDSATHTYSVDGIKYPSVTQILQDEGIIDTAWFSDGSAEKGITIHQLTELVDSNYLVMDCVHEDLRPYIQAYEKFVQSSGVEIINAEIMHYSDTLKFAGTIDREAVLNNNTCLIDIKSGVPLRWHGIQLAAYQILCPAKKLFCLYLKANGKYKLEEYKDSAYNKNIFISALNIYKWKRSGK